MEDEVKRDQVANIVSALDARYGGSDSYTRLTAWHHTDYHFLRVLYPDHRIHSVERTIHRRSVDTLNPEDRRFYGDGILLDPDALSSVPRPWVYFGFEANHAISNFRRVADHLPSDGLRHWARAIADRMAKRSHFDATWICRDPRLELVPVLTLGHYRVAEVVPIASTVGPGERASPGRVEGEPRTEPRDGCSRIFIR